MAYPPGGSSLIHFSEAFDTTDHSILIRKTKALWDPWKWNCWFTSYFHNRRQHVSIGSTKSDDIFITHGVPQRSVLGPLLFLLYINDFSDCSKLFDFHIFADDANLFYSNRSLTELEDVVNNNLKFVSNIYCLMANISSH